TISASLKAVENDLNNFVSDIGSSARIAHVPEIIVSQQRGSVHSNCAGTKEDLCAVARAQFVTVTGLRGAVRFRRRAPTSRLILVREDAANAFCLGTTTSNVERSARHS
ncbi:MAG: hypothetical protein ACKVP5_02830, partial [Aestuariivirga sp.]